MPDKPVFRPGIMLENLHQKSPLIHNITNYVTANDCANILLACGASPIMADDPLDRPLPGAASESGDSQPVPDFLYAVRRETGSPAWNSHCL